LTARERRSTPEAATANENRNHLGSEQGVGLGTQSTRRHPGLFGIYISKFNDLLTIPAALARRLASLV
jgi:hypothetical protein